MPPGRDALDPTLPSQDEMNAFVADMYSQGAADYDRQLLVDCAYRTPGEIARRFAALPRILDRWLDVGAGTGLVGRAMRGAGYSGALLALDLSRDMLEHADAGTYDLFCLADASRPLPFRGASLGGAIVASVTEHIVDPAPMLEELGRVLVRGGTLLLTFRPNAEGRPVLDEPLASLLSHDRAHVLRTVESAGFAIVECREFDGYQSGRDGWVRSALLVAEKTATSAPSLAPAAPSPTRSAAVGPAASTRPGGAAAERPRSSSELYPHLACIACGAPLTAGQEALSCRGCGALYPASGRTVCFGNLPSSPSKPSKIV